MLTQRTRMLFCFLLSVTLLQVPQKVNADVVDFQRDIAPILEERCWYCHGEDEQESGLRLDLRAQMLRGGDSGLPAVRSGQPGQELSDRSRQTSR